MLLDLKVLVISQFLHSTLFTFILGSSLKNVHAFLLLGTQHNIGYFLFRIVFNELLHAIFSF